MTLQRPERLSAPCAALSPVRPGVEGATAAHAPLALSGRRVQTGRCWPQPIFS